MLDLVFDTQGSPDGSQQPFLVLKMALHGLF